MFPDKGHLLEALQQIAVQWDSDMPETSKDQIRFLKRDFEFLHIFLSFTDLSYMADFTYKVQSLFQDAAVDLKKVNKIHHIDRVTSGIEEKIRITKLEIRDIHLVLSNKDGIDTPEFVIEFIDTVIQNLDDFVELGDSVFKELKLLRNFVCFVSGRSMEPKSLHAFLTHVLHVVGRAAMIVWLYWKFPSNDSENQEMNCLLSNLVQMKIKLIQPDVRKIYIDVLLQAVTRPIIQIENAVDCVAGFMETLQHNLKELPTPSQMDVALTDQMLVFLEMFDLLFDNLRCRSVQVLEFHLQDIDTVVVDSGLLVYSLYEDVSLEEVTSKLEDTIERIKTLIYHIIRKEFQSSLPRIHGIGYVDFLLSNLKKFHDRYSNSLAHFTDELQMIQTELESLQPFLKSVALERHNKYDKLERSVALLIGKVYEVEYIVDACISNISNKVPNWCLKLWLLDLIQEIGAEIQVLEVDSASHGTIDTDTSRTSSRLASTQSIEDENDEIVGFEDVIGKIRDQLTRGSNEREIICNDPLGHFCVLPSVCRLERSCSDPKFSAIFPKLQTLFTLSSFIRFGRFKRQVVRFFEGNALVSSDSGLGSPFERFETVRKGKAPLGWERIAGWVDSVISAIAPGPLFLAGLGVCCWLGVPGSLFLAGLGADCMVLFELVHECTFWVYGGPVSRPMMPTEYLLCWYSCYALHLFRDAGKTALANRLYSDKSIVAHFEVRARCYVSSVYSRKELLLSILKLLRVNNNVTTPLSEQTSGELADVFRKHLFTRRYLILIDDVPNVSVWDDLNSCFCDANKGSRILLTTRHFNVADYAKSITLHLRVLNDGESWTLLKKKVFGEGICSPVLEKVGPKIVRKCEGLPLSIVFVASILAGMERTEQCWKQVARSLGTEIHCYPENIIEQSYQNLPYHLKSCFLYFGMFSDHEEINISKLTLLWIGEGFVKDDEHRTLEDIAEGYLKNLVESNLVMLDKRDCGGKVKVCRIHDILFHFCKERAHTENLIQRIQRKANINASSSIANASDMFHDFRFLKVLDLEFTLIDSFPTNMVYLRYFAAQTSHESITSSIHMLWNLETLIVNGMRGHLSVPSTIWNMVKLRHLHISPSFTAEQLLEDSSELNDLLEVLDIFGDQHVESLPYLVRISASNLKKLKVSYYILGSQHLSNISQLQNLQELELDFVKFEGEIWEVRKGEFAELKVLKLVNCSSLKEWTVQDDAFSKLEHIVLRCCQLLVEISSWFAEISSLKYIEVDNCNGSVVESARTIQTTKVEEYVNDDLELVIKEL
uniref:NB-ARC domain containing protein n=1 Tax=Solanum demissum TaxID=50514 RepID=Q6F2D5_SOLDE|nr:NB-ARC domain containing protein [Solanum demissum]